MSDEPFALRARARKAARIAAYLRAYWVVSEGVSLLDAMATMDDDSWLYIAKKAGVNADKPPSETTRAMVLGFLEADMELLKMEVGG